MKTKTTPDGVPEPRHRRYPTDMSDAEWALLEPFLAQSEGPGAPREVETRAIVDALFYKLRTGCQWRMLPLDFPKWSTVSYYWNKWSNNGTWERVNSAFRQDIRKEEGRNEEPSAAVIDSQSVKTTEVGGERGFDGGKKNPRTQAAHRG